MRIQCRRVPRYIPQMVKLSVIRPKVGLLLKRISSKERPQRLQRERFVLGMNSDIQKTVASPPQRLEYPVGASVRIKLVLKAKSSAVVDLRPNSLLQLCVVEGASVGQLNCRPFAAGYDQLGIRRSDRV